MTKIIYKFSKKYVEGGLDQIDILGAKAALLMEMSKGGVPVPPGFTLIAKTHSSDFFGTPGATICLDAALAWLGDEVSQTFETDMKVSVRSGSKYSMPGMLDTVLDIETMYTLTEAIRKVYDSWNNEKAKAYRDIKGIPHDAGTSVTIQVMVDGTADEKSGTGILQTRHPVTGDSKQYAEYIAQAKGPELVDGKTTPKEFTHDNFPELGGIGLDLTRIGIELERHFKYPQEIEFTISRGQLFVLQTRNLKMASKTKTKVAVEMVYENIHTKEEALEMVDLKTVLKIAEEKVDATKDTLFVKGLSASPGIIHGYLVHDREKADAESILLVEETTTDDVQYMARAGGIVTRVGGVTSHAAAVARSMDKPTVVGIGLSKWEPSVGEKVTLDAGAGKLYQGHLPITELEQPEEVVLIKKWSSELS